MPARIVEMMFQKKSNCIRSDLFCCEDETAGIEKPKDYAIFQNRGYQGLYGGLGVKEIHERKGLKNSQKILDHMGSTELEI